MATVQILPRVVPNSEEPAKHLLTRKRKLSMNMDLLAQLAHTAHVMEALPAAGNAQQEQTLSAAVSYGQNDAMTSDLAALSANTRARSSLGRSLESGRGTEAHAKQSKHKQAEQRRRERINDRLAALRELVPHDTRSNTATFLEGVISYIQSLQQSNMALEAQLATLRSSKGAEHAQQSQRQAPARSSSAVASFAAAAGTIDEVMQQASLAAQLAQPCLSGVGAAGTASAQHAGTPPPGGGFEGLPNHRAASAGTYTTHPGTPYVPSDLLPSILASAVRQQQHTEHPKPAQSSPTAAAAAAYALAAAAADAQARPANSAPAALTAAEMLAAAGSPAPATPTALGGTSAAAPASSAQLPPIAPLQLQPAQLQSALEKALLTALQQQVQQFAAQMPKPDA